AIDDRLHSRFEQCNWRAFGRGSPHILGETRPVGEGIPTRQRDSRIVESDRHTGRFLLGHALRQPRDCFVKTARMIVSNNVHRLSIPCAPAVNQHLRLEIVITKRGIKREGLHFAITLSHLDGAERYMRRRSSIKARFCLDVLQLTRQRQPLYACSSATPQVLTKHVGVYSGLWGTAQTPRTVEVTLSAGRLVATIDHRTPP